MVDLAGVRELVILILSLFIFSMQAGFAMLEAGTVRAKNVQYIMFKNIMDTSISAICWLAIGWGLSHGKGSNAFCGLTDFALTDTRSYAIWFFGFTFCATSCTICSGSIAERVYSESHFIFVIIMCSFIYPIAAFWIWNPDGWMFPGNRFGVIDWAGGGVVHITGGFAGLIGTWITGPRVGRFETDIHMTGHSAPLQVLGTFLLWTAWYAFNVGSSFTHIPSPTSGDFLNLNGRIAVTTTMSAASAAIIGALCTKHIDGYYCVPEICNALLAGLVSITSGCATMEPGWAIPTGAIGGLVYYGSAKLLVYLKIDDPVEASCVHGFCGIWAMIAAALFSSKSNITQAYNMVADDEWMTRSVMERLGHQIFACLILIAWTVSLSAMTFFTIDKIMGLRVTSEMEKAGLDAHDGSSWTIVAHRGGRDASFTGASSIEITGNGGMNRSMNSMSTFDDEEIPTPMSRVERTYSNPVTIDDTMRNSVQVVMMKGDAGLG